MNEWEPNSEQRAIITKVEKQKRSRHRYNIFINEEFAFSVHEDIMIKHRLLKGEEILQAQAAEVLQDEERNDAYTTALRLIGRRPHAAKELRRKLKERGFEEAAIVWTCEMLERQNYLNDEEFAKTVTEHRVYAQRKGRNWVRQELRQKGVAKEFVQDALEAIDPDQEWSIALQLGRSKWEHTSGTAMDRRRKTAAYLLRRGFAASLASKVISELLKHQSLDEELEEFDFAEEIPED